MLPKVPEICSRGRLHNWKLDRRKPHWPKNQLVPRLEEEAGVHLRPNWLPPSPVFVACTSIYQRGEAVGCIRGLPKQCTVVGNNCVRGNGCPKSSTVGSQPHIAQTFRHRSSSSEDKLIFYFSCLASIGLDTSAPIFHWNHMESATFDWSITFVERWGILTVSGLPSFLPSLCPHVTVFAYFACHFKCPPLVLILHDGINNYVYHPFKPIERK